LNHSTRAWPAGDNVAIATQQRSPRGMRKTGSCQNAQRRHSQSGQDGGQQKKPRGNAAFSQR
jgi:hypothetical protein